MDLKNPYFMLHHFVARVEYSPLAEVDAYFSDPDYFKHFDSLGQGIALSAVKLPDDAAEEDEVRLIFSLSQDSEWAKQHVHVLEDFVLTPFDWGGALDKLVLGPHMQTRARDNVESQLRNLGIDCPIVGQDLTR